MRGKRTRAQGLLDGITGRPRQSEVEIPSGPRYGFAQPIVVQGCLGGVGVGVDDNNIITALRPGHPAHACGLMELGDRVISIDGVRLAYKGQVWKLAQVMKRSSMHIFGVERRLWEEDEDGNRIPDEDEEPETRGVFQSDVVEPAAVAVADDDDDQPMGSSLAEPGITWQGVAIEITVQVPDKVNAGQRFQFVCPDQAAVLLRCPTPYPHQGRFAWRWHGPGAPVPIDVQAPAGVNAGDVLAVLLPDGRRLPVTCPRPFPPKGIFTVTPPPAHRCQAGLNLRLRLSLSLSPILSLSLCIPLTLPLTVQGVGRDALGATAQDAADAAAVWDGARRQEPRHGRGQQLAGRSAPTNPYPYPYP